MESQKDIGELIRQKVDSTPQTLEAPVWLRVKQTLIKEKRKKTFYNWSLNGFIVLFTTVGLYTLATTLDPVKTASPKEMLPSSSIKKTIEDTPENKAFAKKEKHNTNPDQVVKLEKTRNVFIPKNSHDNTATFTKEQQETTHLTKNKNQNIATKTPPNPSSTPEKSNAAQRTEKVYHYYNSKDGKEVMTQDKTVIDSLLITNPIKKDSLR